MAASRILQNREFEFNKSINSVEVSNAVFLVLRVLLQLEYPEFNLSNWFLIFCFSQFYVKFFGDFLLQVWVPLVPRQPFPCLKLYDSLPLWGLGNQRVLMSSDIIINIILQREVFLNWMKMITDERGNLIQQTLLPGYQF